MIRKTHRALVSFLLAGMLLLASAPAGAGRIEGVEFAERVTLGGVDLKLQGVALLRYKVFFKGYVAALYLEPTTQPTRVLEDVPRRLEIEYFWSIPANLFAEATVDGIRKNIGETRFAALEPRIERFNALYADVQPGDRYEVSYRPGVGTELALNGESRGLVEGSDFAEALFSIWLGEAPFSESMKQQLLADPAGPLAPAS